LAGRHWAPPSAIRIVEHVAQLISPARGLIAVELSAGDAPRAPRGHAPDHAGDDDAGDGRDQRCISHTQKALRW
jgi:hypothetical protein